MGSIKELMMDATNGIIGELELDDSEQTWIKVATWVCAQRRSWEEFKDHKALAKEYVNEVEESCAEVH